MHTRVNLTVLGLVNLQDHAELLWEVKQDEHMHFPGKEAIVFIHLKRVHGP